MRIHWIRSAAVMGLAVLFAVPSLAGAPTTAAQPAAAKPAAAQPAAKTAAAPALEKATFAGGCFWCLETAFEGLAGVKSVISGFTGGITQNPSYDQVSAGGTGHAEAVQITYEPKTITYEQLLDIFWHNIDPTQSNGQFCDQGNQYRSAIFYQDATQKKLAEASKATIETTPQRFKGRNVTQVVVLDRFWPAEEYHQDFYRKDPDRYQSYRTGCGRDRRLTELWGKPGRQGHAPTGSAAAH